MSAQILIKEQNGKKEFVLATEVRLADPSKVGTVYRHDGLFLVVREDSEGNELPAYKFPTLTEALKFVK